MEELRLVLAKNGRAAACIGQKWKSCGLYWPKMEELQLVLAKYLETMEELQLVLAKHLKTVE